MGGASSSNRLQDFSEVCVTAQMSSRPSVVATTLVVFTAAFLASLDLFIVNVAYPDISHAFHNADLAAMSWMLTAYTIVFAAVLTPAGRLGDRYGHRRIFLTGLTAFLAGSLCCGLSTTFAMLVASRVLQALGAGMLMPSSLALLLAAVPAARRTRAVAMWSAVGAMAAAIGPPLGGVLVGFSWQWIFLVNLPVGALAVAVGRFVLKETAPSGSRMPDLVGALALVVGVAALVWALIEVPTVSNGTIVALAATVGMAAIAVTVWRSHGHHTPIIDLVAIRATPLWITCLTQMLFATAFGAMLLGNVLFLIVVWHEKPAVAGLLLSPGAIVVVVVSATLAGRLIDRWGVGFVAASGAVLYAAGAIVWLCRVGPEPNYFADFLPGQILTGTGIGLVMPSLAVVPGRALPAHRWGAGSALMNTARQLGSVLGTVIVTFVYQPVIDLAAVRLGWVLIIAAAVASALAAVALAVTWASRSDDAVNPSLRRGSDKRTFTPLVGHRPRMAERLAGQSLTSDSADTNKDRRSAQPLAGTERSLPRWMNC
jgi:EmrB/QacA subfamily drug resistance transporter